MKVFCSSLLLLLISAAALFGQRPAGASVLTLDLSTEQDQFLPNEAMMVTVRISNSSGRAVPLGAQPDWLKFSVESSDNLVVSRLGEVPVDGTLLLQSSLSATRKLNLTPYFDFRRPGHYQITATLKLPEMGLTATSKPKSFDVVRGTKLKELEFGVPPAPGATNQVPEIRKYLLQQANRKELQLYVRITDLSEARTFRVFPISHMTSFSQPEAQLDRASNLHVLNQDGARSFNYSVINPDGDLLVRQTYDYTTTRPRLAPNAEGGVVIVGGERRLARSDLPAVAKNSNGEPTQPDAKDQKP
jgi:hypothetical protein